MQIRRMDTPPCTCSSLWYTHPPPPWLAYALPPPPCICISLSAHAAAPSHQHQHQLPAATHPGHSHEYQPNETALYMEEAAQAEEEEEEAAQGVEPDDLGPDGSFSLVLSDEFREVLIRSRERAAQKKLRKEAEAQARGAAEQSPDERRATELARVQSLYGQHARSVQQAETVLQCDFNRLVKQLQPPYWPAEPLNPRFA
jgi:hypothetical protein